ncbi:MAG: hypothetical protein R2698_04290 [Microthrixaceae bacterium]
MNDRRVWIAAIAFVAVGLLALGAALLGSGNTPQRTIAPGETPGFVDKTTTTTPHDGTTVTAVPFTMAAPITNPQAPTTTPEVPSTLVPPTAPPTPPPTAPQRRLPRPPPTRPPTTPAPTTTVPPPTTEAPIPAPPPGDVPCRAMFDFYSGVRFAGSVPIETPGLKAAFIVSMARVQSGLQAANDPAYLPLISIFGDYIQRLGAAADVNEFRELGAQLVGLDRTPEGAAAVAPLLAHARSICPALAVHQ